MIMKKISIIITTHNRKKLIKTAVKSALIQTYPEKEIIVVDDNSEYDIFKELEEFKEDITIIQNSRTMGVSATSNRGVEECSGQYVTFLNDDDVFHPRKIERQVKIFGKRETIGLVYCPIATKFGNKLYYEPLKKEKNCWVRLGYQNNIGITPLIKKECLSVCGGFDTTLEYHEDRDLWYRIGKKYRFWFDNEPSYIIYNHKIHRMSSDLERICQGKMRLFEKHKEDFENKNSFFSDLYYELAYEHLRFHCYREFFKYVIKSIKMNPRTISEYKKIPFKKISGICEREIDQEIEKIFD